MLKKFCFEADPCLQMNIHVQTSLGADVVEILPRLTLAYKKGVLYKPLLELML